MTGLALANLIELTVRVSGYTRMVNGKQVRVSGYTRTGNALKQVFSPLLRSEFSDPDTPRSRSVTPEEFQQIAREGQARVLAMKAHSSDPVGLDKNWPTLKKRAWAETRKPWGGMTVDAHTGVALAGNENKYALTVKPDNLETIRVSDSASEADFDKAMERARTQFAPVLSRQNAYLGLFHDDLNNSIDIDPVTVVDSLHDVETIGAYTRAVGGAYNFADGNGYWPPHVGKAGKGTYVNEALKGLHGKGLQGDRPLALAGRSRAEERRREAEGKGHQASREVGPAVVWLSRTRT